MAHFAKVDENGVVLDVIVVANAELLDADGNESEAKGIAFCKSLFGDETNWVQTSYNNNFRTRYASIGGTYDAQRDIFIGEQPFPSWTLDQETTEWMPPTPKPQGPHYWDEMLLAWVPILDN